MLPTFSGDMLFCATSARNAEISAVIEDVSSYLCCFATKVLLILWAVKDKKSFTTFAKNSMKIQFAVDLLYLHR